MRKKGLWGVKKVVAKFMVLVLMATSFSVGGTLSSNSEIVVEAAESYDSSKNYAGGSEVEYEGSVYKANWWANPGEYPGKNSGQWTLVSGGSGEGTGGSGGNTEVGTGGTLEGSYATETLNPKVGTNIQGVTLPANYYEKKVVGYFPNYAIDSEAHKKFNIADLQWDVLTHVQYAFGVVNKDTYKLEAGDIENDINNKFEDRKFYHDGQEIKMDDSLGYYGQFNLMHTLKKMHPNVTVLISTGGWGASEGLWYATQNEETMRTFSASAVEFIRKYGFDGIDIDFEFPSETPLSGNYTDFTESIRPGIAARYTQFIKILSEDLGKASKEDGKYYWLTSAVSASSWVLGGQTNSDFLDYLDFVSIMSYDFHGGWNNYVENQANIYPDPADGETATQAVKTLGFEWAYRFYRGKVQSEKILMGVPYYTRGWTNVQGGTNGLHGTSGSPLTNATDNLNLWYDLDANGNETPAGANPLWHVMNVMNDNSNYKRFWDDVGKVPYVWNDVNKSFLTFEDMQSIQERINYVNNNNLGGVLIWVMHGDYDYDAARDEYVVGDTLTSMLYNQFKEAGASTVTSDIDITNKTLDFDVDFGGTYDHPNYTYTIKVKNNASTTIPAGFTFSFYLPRSSEFTSSWGGAFSTRIVDNSFTEVTLTSSSALEAGGTVEFTGMLKCCFAAAKNFKINGYSMLSEVNEEIRRLNRAYITEENGGSSTPVEPPTTEVPTTEAPTTEEPTTANPVTSTVKVSIKGCQISTTVEGYRTIYSVDDPDNEVEKVGLVYGLADLTNPEEMVVNSSNSKVYNYDATEKGKITLQDTTSDTMQHYAMTMTFIKTQEFYTADLYVRAYAQLKDGSYVYSDCATVNVYDIAEELYQGVKMKNYQGHAYLYENILKVVTPSYKEVEFSFENMLV